MGYSPRVATEQAHTAMAMSPMPLYAPEVRMKPDGPLQPSLGRVSLDGEDPLGRKMATHSSILAWKIPWTEEPGGLQSMGSQRVGHD